MVKSPLRTPYGRAVAKSHATSAARLEVHHCQAQIVLNTWTNKPWGWSKNDGNVLNKPMVYDDIIWKILV